MKAKGVKLGTKLKVLHSAGFARLVAIVKANRNFAGMDKRDILDVVTK
jgi:hypothetical protein